MFISIINLGNFGSTGKIVRGLIRKIKENANNDVLFAYPANKLNTEIANNDYIICPLLIRKINVALSFATGLNSCFALFATEKLVRRLKKKRPDVIHLHNIHKSYINAPVLFNYIKKNNIPVIWTLHDCWAFTGRCSHFTLANCDHWKNGCKDCNYPRMAYPEALFNQSALMWKLKKKWFLGVKNLTIVTPSEWLADLTRRSFLKDYPIRVIHNGIDLSVFRPTESQFRNKKGIDPDANVVLGVAFGWGVRKGLDVFLKLSHVLPSNYQIVLVGIDVQIESTIPSNIIVVRRTQNQHELAEIYSAADVFLNPTREDNFPTVNIEALACGTPVVTVKTGGSPECIDKTCGLVVENDDIPAIAQAIVDVCEKNLFSSDACVARAKAFDQNQVYAEYVDLYRNVINKYE